MIKTAAGATVGTNPPGRFLRVREVSRLTGLPVSTIYAFVAAGLLPKQVRIGPRCAAWVENEVLAWQAARLAERDRAAA